MKKIIAILFLCIFITNCPSSDKSGGGASSAVNDITGAPDPETEVEVCSANETLSDIGVKTSSGPNSSEMACIVHHGSCPGGHWTYYNPLYARAYWTCMAPYACDTGYSWESSPIAKCRDNSCGVGKKWNGNSCIDDGCDYDKRWDYSNMETPTQGSCVYTSGVPYD